MLATLPAFARPWRIGVCCISAAAFLVLAVHSLPSAALADGIMLVRAGAFWMGEDGGDPDAAPLHLVFVRDFWIERHKVTNAEFALFLDAHGPVSPAGQRRYDWDDPDARIHRTGDGWTADVGFERQPVVEVSWAWRVGLLSLAGPPASHRGGVGKGGARRRSPAVS